MANKNTNQEMNLKDLSMQDIYDMLMFDIEPDLMTDMIPTLDERYKDETQEEHKARVERYKSAFQEFYDRFNMMLALWKDHVVNFKKDMFDHLRDRVISGEQDELSDIEDSIEQS